MNIEDLKRALDDALAARDAASNCLAWRQRETALALDQYECAQGREEEANEALLAAEDAASAAQYAYETANAKGAQ